MPKIAFVINSLSNGGAERTISNITRNLGGGYSCDIIVNNDSEVAYPVEGNVISLGLKAEKNKLKFGYQILAFVKRIVTLRRIKKEKKYDAVFSFSESASIANILSGKSYCKVIVSVRIHLSSMAGEWLYRFIGFPIIRVIYNHADKIVAVSEGVRYDLIDNFGIDESHIITIPNGCDLARIDKLASEELSDSEKIALSGENVIVTMGRLDYQKGQRHLIRALKHVKDEGVDFKLLVLGQGPMLENLEEMVESYGLHDNVIFMGFCENPFRILHNADIYVLPSLFEGMGNSLIEAMACGLPCISTDHDSGAREILAPDTDARIKNKTSVEHASYGVLVPVPDGKTVTNKEHLSNEEVMMAAAIEEMLTKEDIRNRYRQKAIERAGEMNSGDVAMKWMNLVEGIL